MYSNKYGIILIVSMRDRSPGLKNGVSKKQTGMKHRWPAWLASGLMIVMTTFWTYWAVEESGSDAGVFVSFNGWVNAAYKMGGNPRYSYRCVRPVE